MTLRLQRAGLHYWMYFEKPEVHADGAKHLYDLNGVKDIDAFNGTLHRTTEFFDFELFNAVVFGGNMEYCNANKTVVSNETPEDEELAGPPIAGVKKLFSATPWFSFALLF